MSKDRNIVVLAALLHDIGKFYQRADDAGAKRSEHLQSEIKRLEEMYCPLINNSWRGYKHVVWTAQFLADHEPFFKGLLRDDYARFFKATVSHHRPDPADVWQLLVQQADHFSAGADRTQQSGMQDAQAERGWDRFKNVRMTSIFQSVGPAPEQDRMRLPIASLRLMEDYFPQHSIAVPGQPEYASLWREFSEAFLVVKEQTNSVNALIENLLALFAKFLVNVPSSTQHLPDVSLYDHLKSTAAMAAGLYDFWDEKGWESNLPMDMDETPLLLIGGDLSGIQQYIYDIIAKNAAKNLKGRSFYLYLLVDNIVRSLLRQLDLPSSAVLYQSGGGFYLLAPNTAFIRSSLTAFQRRIEGLIFQEHKTRLFLGLAAVPVSKGMIFRQEIGQAWQAIMQAIATTKRQKHKVELIDDYEAFFSPQEIGGKQQRDAISGEEFSEEEGQAILTGKLRPSIVELEDGFVMRTTYNQIELGKKLRDTQWWIVSPHRIRAWDKFGFELCGLGLFNYLFSESELHQAIALFCPDEVTVVCFDPERLSNGPTLVRGRNNIFQFQFYGGNDHPRDPEGNPITFDQLAKAGGGAQKLGILRMDIDNLGALFATGLGPTDRTFSKYSALSRNLDYFFKGYLNKIWQREEFCQTTSIVYAGGDDLFIVGFWSSLIDMAQRIRTSFADWTCHNPVLTLSGGLAVVPGKFPISKAAEMAEVAEKQAKAHYYHGQLAKNAFTFLHKPLRWEEELASVQLLKEQMVRYVEAGQLPRGFLQKMIRYAQLADHQETYQLNPSWRWHMAYDFARALGRTKHEEARDFYTQLRLSAYRGRWESGSSYSYLQILEIAARWAELETKI